MKKRIFLLVFVTFAACAGNNPQSAIRNRQFTVTAYCPCKICCGKWAGGKTASGSTPRAGVTVAGPRSLPFGTRVRIPGVGERVVQDRLARKYDARIDVFFATHKEARKFGIQQLDVTLLK